jgi:hypothetical protein
MKKILVLLPKNTLTGQPSNERVATFSEWFVKKGMSLIETEQPSCLREKWRLIKLLKREKIENVFISMPDFRNWWLFLLKDINIILDIRDGWSIAMRSGYGGNSKPKKVKAWIASRVEKFAMNKAALTITCTPGLQEYLQNLTRKDVLLILNGCSEKDKQIVGKIKSEMVFEKCIDEVVAICVGQFSEYGRTKAEAVIRKLSKIHISQNLVLRLVGSDFEANRWIDPYLDSKNISNVRCEILERMDRKEMYKQILMSDIGVVIIRDPDYDFGTKVFDYLLCEKMVFNYFDHANRFSDHFFTNNKELNYDLTREGLVERNASHILAAIT